MSTNDNPTLYSIHFNLNGGEGDFQRDFAYYPNEQMEIISDIPTMVGSEFRGWQRGNGHVYYAGDIITFDEPLIILTAIWGEVPLGTVTFNLDGGTGELSPISFYFNEGFTIPEAIPEKEGFTFCGWSNKYGTAFMPGDKYELFEEADVLTAIWEYNVYTIIFNPTGGTYDWEGVNEVYWANHGWSISIYAPYKDEHTFLYWEDEDGNRYVEGDTYEVTNREMTFMAVWEKWEDITITFDAKGGQYDWDSINIPKGTTAPVFEPYKEGWTFSHWIDQYGDIYYATDDLPTFDRDTTLTAVWTSSSYIMDYSNTLPEELVTPGDSYVITLSVPAKEGHTFVNWSYGDNTYNAGDTITPAGNITFVPNWQRYAYVIKHEGIASSSIVNIGESYIVTSAVPSKEDHTFVCWKCGDETYNAGDLVTPTGDMDFIAVWESNYHTLTFDLNGRVGSFDPIIRLENESVILSLSPSRAGYIFKGWRNTEGDVYLPDSSYTFTDKNDTLTAIWEELTYPVTYNLEGGDWDIEEQLKLHHSNYIIPTIVPTKENHVFYRWEDERGLSYQPGGVYKNNAPVTLKALWKEKFTVTYLDAEGGIFEKVENIIEGDTITVSEAVPENDDLTFSHWQILEYNSTCMTGAEFTVTRDITFTPVYYVDYGIFLWDGDTLYYECISPGNSRFRIPATPPTKDGYNFVCWREEETGRIVHPGEMYVGGERSDFQAVWVESTKKMVIYDLNGGTGDFPDEVVDKTVQNTVYSSVPEKEGYIFDCWEIVWTSEESFCLNYKLAPDSIFPDNCHMILKACYLKIRVNVKNLPSSRAINRAVTSTLQLETDVYPTANDFTETWTPTTPNPVTYNMRSAIEEDAVILSIQQFASSDERVATITQNGVLTLHKSGITVISFHVIYTYKNRLLHQLVEIPIYVYALSENEDETIFTHDTEIPEEVRGMAIEKMNGYYNDDSDLKSWIDEGNTCIFAFEGLGGTTGVVNDLHPEGFLKAMMVVTKGKNIEYVTRNASTLPDKRPDMYNNEEYKELFKGKPGYDPEYEAITTLKDGVYDYYVGNHGGYIALRQSEFSRPSWYINPNNNQKFYTSTAGGINIHATNKYPAGNTGPFSAGCQTVYWEDYVAFGQAVGFLDFLDEDKKFESDLNPNRGLTSYMIDLVGSVIQHNSDKFPNTIKYILDREYDVNNGPTSEWSYGIFYPHNESGILERETE